MATKRFSKYDTVTVLGDWDSKGKFFYRHATVHSCGAKRMVLTCAATGEEIGRRFDPMDPNVIPRVSDHEATVRALELAAQFLVVERQRIEQRIEEAHGKGWGDAYVTAMHRHLDALHEPQVVQVPVQ